MMYRPEMYRSWIKTLVFGSLGLTCSLVADFSLAQTKNAETVFGQAVHQYFGGQYQEAVNDLSVALEAGIEDPRLYYYRGLSQLQMGDQTAAEADFAMGAEIEAQYAGRRNFNIGRSLMRVQGATRMMIENARSQARLQSEELANQSRPVNRRQALNLLQQRAAAANAADPTTAESMPSARPNLPDLSNVVDPTAPFSDNVPLPPPRSEEPENQPADASIGNEVEAGSDPFGQPAEAEPADEPFNVPENTVPENTQPADDPFAEPADTPADAPADEPADDPFGQPSDQPADEPAMEEPAADPFAEPTEDPFPPSNDPFSEPAGNETPAPAADPFAEPAEEPAASEPNSSADKPSAAIPANVRGGKVLSGLFGALTAPVRKAANAGANAMQNLPGGLPGQQPPAGFGEPDFGEQPGGNPFGDEDPFK